MQWTLKQFAMAVKAADRGTQARSLGSYLRDAWAKVRPGTLSLMVTCRCKLAWRTAHGHHTTICVLLHWSKGNLNPPTLSSLTRRCLR